MQVPIILSSVHVSVIVNLSVTVYVCPHEKCYGDPRRDWILMTFDFVV